MSMLFKYDEFQTCLYELESALSHVGIRDCANMQDSTQLSAAISVLLRATSLFRATLLLLESGLMDASDVVRRGCWEAWMLGYEFRITSAAQHAALWHKDKNNHGLAKIKRVTAFEEANGIAPSKYGSAYGGLSEVSHPNKLAAENSINTVNIVHGADQTEARIAYDTITEQDLPPMLYLLIWTVVAEAKDLITLGIKLDTMPKCIAFFHLYQSLAPGAPTI